MMNYQNPSKFSKIYVKIDFGDLSWNVIGEYNTPAGNEREVIDNFPNMVLADTFVRVYTEEYIRYSRFDSAQDC